MNYSINHAINNATHEMRWETALQAAIFAMDELVKLAWFKEDEIDVDDDEFTAHTEAFEAAMQDMEGIQHDIDQATADRDDDFWCSAEGEDVSDIIDFDFSDFPDYEDLDALIFMADCLSDIGGFTFPADLKFN